MVKIVKSLRWNLFGCHLLWSRGLFTMSSPVVVDAKKSPHTATVIFLHGLGDTGHGWAQTIAQIKPSYAKCICPTAPRMPVTLNAGFEMPSWFDLKSLDVNGPEDEEGIHNACKIVHKLIEEEESKYGIPSTRVLVGGFSQGGALALHSAFRYPKRLAGVIAFSCWLPLHKQYPDALQSANKDIPVLQCHGDADPIVPMRWGLMSSGVISKFITNYEFKKYKGLMHSSCDEELRDARNFMMKHLPEIK